MKRRTLLFALSMSAALAAAGALAQAPAPAPAAAAPVPDAQAPLDAAAPDAPPPPRPAVTLSLPQCIERVLSQSVEMDMVRAGLAVSEGQMAQARRARWLPHLELTNIFTGIPEAHCPPITPIMPFGDWMTSCASGKAAGDHNFLTNLSPFNNLQIDAIQPLYTFGKLDAAMALATAGLNVREEGVRQKQYEIVNRVRLLYWGVLLAGDIDGILSDVRKNLDDAYESTKEKLDAGSAQVTNVDIYKLEVFRAQVAAKSEDLYKQRTLAQRTMNLLLGLEPEQDFAPAEEHLGSPTTLLKPLDYYKDSARRNRPEARQLGAGLKAREAQVDLARANLYPDFFLGGRFVWSTAPNRRLEYAPLPSGSSANPFLGDSNNALYGGGFLGLKWDLSLHRKDAELQTARAELFETQAQARAARFGFDLKVEDAYLEVIRARNAHDALNQALNSARKWFRSTTLNYSIGVTDTDELIKAYQNYVMLRGEYFKALFEYNQALAALELESAAYDTLGSQESAP